MAQHMNIINRYNRLSFRFQTFFFLLIHIRNAIDILYNKPSVTNG